MSKQVSFDEKGINAMLKGLDVAYRPVAHTMGPKGGSVFIGGNIPRLSTDGFTVATNIILENPEEDSGAYIIRNVCSQQNDDAGDGTTTVAVLTKSLIDEALARPENPKHIKDSLKEAGNKVLKILSRQSKKINKKDVGQVAVISSENKELSKFISEIINKLGEKAVINVEDSKTFSTSYEITDGYEAHVGFMSPRFITDKKTAKAIYQDVAILCTEKKISNIADISQIFNSFAFETNKEGKIMGDQNGKPVPSKNPVTQCVIVCDDIDDSMLGMFVQNFEMKTFGALVIRATSLLLEDIAGYTGATVISNSTGVNFQNFKREHLGFAKKVVSDANKTLFIGNGFSHKQYIKELQVKTNGEPNMWTQKNMQSRVDKLSGGIAVLKIGASTDFEREYLKYKAEDAVKAVQSALEEGIVEGGGMALYRIGKALNPKTVGEEIIKKALTSPLKKIIENTGQDYTEIITNMPEGLGYDAKNNTYVDMIKVGIIDPHKVTRCALENAVSASSTFITTKGYLITDVPEKPRVES